MTRRIPTPVLLGLALAALALNAAVTGGAAVAENDVVSALGASGQVPAGAFLTGPVLDSAEVEGLRVEVRPHQGAYALILTNDSRRDRTLDLAVQMTQESGSRMGRMGPRTQLLGRETIAAVVPAGETLTRVLGQGIYGVTAAAVSPVAPPAGDEALEQAVMRSMSGDFVSHGFALMTADDDWLATLSVEVGPAEEAASADPALSEVPITVALRER